jgi:hypothetical protein
MLSLTGGVTTTERFDVEQTDALDNWSRRRAEAMAVANVSGAKYSSPGNYPSQGNGGSNTWVYNPYYDMYTYIPMSGAMCNPFYGLCFYSPMAAYQTFIMMPMMYGYSPSVGGYHSNAANPGTSAASSNWSRATGVATAPTVGSAAAPTRSTSGTSLGSGSLGTAGSGSTGGLGSGLGSSGSMGGGHAAGGTASHGK